MLISVAITNTFVMITEWKTMFREVQLNLSTDLQIFYIVREKVELKHAYNTLFENCVHNLIWMCALEIAISEPDEPPGIRIREGFRFSMSGVCVKKKFNTELRRS